MRPHKLLLAGLLVAVAATGCSRLTFVRPKGGVKPVQTPASDYHVSDDKATRKRIEESESLGMAEQRLRVGDLDTAERESNKVLRANPKSAAAHTILAIVDGARGDTKGAGEHYRQAAELAPQDGGMMNNYGAWLCANGYPAEALVWFDRAIAAPGYPTPAAALANAGGCALQTGQYERVERDLRKALALDPNNAYALLSMARNEHRIGHDMDARAFIERRIAAAPVDASVLQLAADIENRLGDKAAAERYRQRLRAEFPQAAAASPGDSARP
ncbi:type IV pilus biogenesis/stability protein PilW [Pseudoxanthomonas winnipegensis]|uniref:Type IV pilus biogenesis/stability protein PilW n=1 Tax=Pseudoxanthomonas winnipegensis TaxID=2480810 RepID=A0A4Q8LY12_9GAMM|nr:type IV pilus biogenesis/stability protein PilW [Pseudoxanthomonas winnipegensis]RZZ90370.1 type IV pilus biogenesis/stability protein PilW [Pseudoxanthomonas winnipegensis]TAA37473.1 type IV pilus biogenesis/stability protein PilW [Pseudoxanthomonas winnipegensis]